MTRKIALGKNWHIDEKGRLVVSRYVPQMEKIRQRKSKKVRVVKPKKGSA